MYTIGIDLGGTNIAAGLCDGELRIVDKESVPTLASRDAESIVKDMAELTKRIIKRNSLKLSDIDYVGIVSPGAVDTERGIVERAFNLPFKNFALADEFKKFLPIDRVAIANDANGAALAEALVGAAKGTRNSIMITLGTGVGGGIILDGRIFSGGISCAGAELGHTVIVAGGRQCTCGRRGCFEAYSSATALTQMTKEKMRELELKGIHSALFDAAAKEGRVSARTAFDAKRAGDKYGAELVDSYIFYLAAGVTDMINIFQPEVISIGGGVSNEKDNLIIPLTKLVEEEQFTRDNERKTRIVRAALGNDAGIVGAAGLLRE